MDFIALLVVDLRYYRDGFSFVASLDVELDCFFFEYI